MKKRLVLLVLCFAMVFTFFSACNGNNEDTGKIDIASKDFKGEKFYYLGSIIVADPADDKDSKVEPGTLPYLESREDEVLYNQCLYIEDTYNCKIIRGGFGYPTTASFAAAFAAGNVKADFCRATLKELRDYYTAGILEDLEKISTIDAKDEEKWGIMSKRDAGSYGGVLYAFPVMGSMYTPFVTTYSGALIYNYELYDSFNVGKTPREMVEDGSWTFDNFLSLLYKVSDTAAQRPVFGLQMKNSLPSVVLGANGANTIMQKNGKYYCGYRDQKTINALEWARKVYQSGCIGGDIEKNTAVFCLLSSSDAIGTECPTVHWVPFPSGPDVEYLSGCAAYFGYHEAGTSIFKHSDDPNRKELVGFVMDKLFAPTEEWGKDGYDKYMSRNFFADEYDYNVYKNGVINMNYQYGLEISENEELLQQMQTIVNGCVENPSGSIKNNLLPLSDAFTETIIKDLNRSISDK